MVVERMNIKLLFGLPEELEVVSCDVAEKVMTLTGVSTQTAPCCPLCGTSASRVHSSYSRQLADVPCAGRRVCLILHVRKFFCDVQTCAQKIFVERLTPFAQPWARTTQRLYQIVQVLGLATGGRLGLRVMDRLGRQTTHQTILRCIMALLPEPIGKVSQIGIDDFSFRRGRKFGTLVVDLQTHKVLDVLADRSVETSAAWMAAHPELEIVSRDRGGDYAAAARKAASQARQTADRFHLSKKLN
jgi:transposase